MKPIHPNTLKRVIAGTAAAVAILLAFGLVTSDQAKAVTTNAQPLIEAGAMLVGFVGTVWHPKHKP